MMIIIILKKPTKTKLIIILKYILKSKLDIYIFLYIYMNLEYI